MAFASCEPITTMKDTVMIVAIDDKTIAGSSAIGYAIGARLRRTRAGGMQSIPTVIDSSGFQHLNRL